MSSKDVVASGMDIKVHPLAIMNIADHYTRSITQFKQPQVFGALFGVQQGRDVNIYDAFEIGIEMDEKMTPKEPVHLLFEAFEEDMTNYKKVFVNYEFLGWYTSGKSVSAEHSSLHQRMLKYNERPLFLLLDPSLQSNSKDIPVSLYEEEVYVRQDQSVTEFVRTPFRIQPDEAERIAAVHCAQLSDIQHTDSKLTSNVQGLHKAVKTLKERVQVLTNFLRDVELGKVSADQNLLRQIKGICNRLPTMDSTQFEEDFLNEYNDALLVTYLATVTRSSDAMSQVISKFELAHDSRPGSQALSGRRGFVPFL
jgi:COP9 signalosome complex subunit 6